MFALITAMIYLVLIVVTLLGSHFIVILLSFKYDSVIEGVLVSGVVVVGINDVVDDIEEDEELFESISSVVIEFKEELVEIMAIEEYGLEESVEVLAPSFVVEALVPSFVVEVIVPSFVVEVLVPSFIVELFVPLLSNWAFVIDTSAVVELSHDVTINKLKENNKKRKYLIKFIFFFHLILIKKKRKKFKKKKTLNPH